MVRQLEKQRRLIPRAWSACGLFEELGGRERFERKPCRPHNFNQYARSFSRWAVGRELCTAVPVVIVVVVRDRVDKVNWLTSDGKVNGEVGTGTGWHVDRTRETILPRYSRRDTRDDALAKYDRRFTFIS